MMVKQADLYITSFLPQQLVHGAHMSATQFNAPSQALFTQLITWHLIQILEYNEAIMKAE